MKILKNNSKLIKETPKIWDNKRIKNQSKFDPHKFLPQSLIKIDTVMLCSKFKNIYIKSVQLLIFYKINNHNLLLL